MPLGAARNYLEKLSRHLFTAQRLRGLREFTALGI
jgi:hypothetical protein